MIVCTIERLSGPGAHRIHILADEHLEIPGRQCSCTIQKCSGVLKAPCWRSAIPLYQTCIFKHVLKCKLSAQPFADAWLGQLDDQTVYMPCTEHQNRLHQYIAKHHIHSAQTYSAILALERTRKRQGPTTAAPFAVHSFHKHRWLNLVSLNTLPFCHASSGCAGADVHCFAANEAHQHILRAAK